LLSLPIGTGRSARATRWESYYGYRTLLLETLVDANRFCGTCYRAANWLQAGKTAGRGRVDRQHKTHGQAVKDSA